MPGPDPRLVSAIDPELWGLLRRACSRTQVELERWYRVPVLAQLVEIVLVEEAASVMEADGATRTEAVDRACARYGLKTDTHLRRLRRWREANRGGDKLSSLADGGRCEVGSEAA